jgi:hypothetical protein
MDYKSTLSAAQAYTKNGKLEDWIHAYLLSDGNNKAFSDGLKLVDRTYLGPYRMPLSLFKRCCGPEETMKWRVDLDGFEKRVENLKRLILSDYDLPPLIIQFVNGQFELNDGNHRHEAYTRLGIKEVDVIIWITENHDVERFIAKYSQYLK